MAYHVAFEPDEVYLHLKRLSSRRVVHFDTVQKIGEELVTSFQDAESN